MQLMNHFTPHTECKRNSKDTGYGDFQGMHFNDEHLLTGSILSIVGQERTEPGSGTELNADSLLRMADMIVLMEASANGRSNKAITNELRNKNATLPEYRKPNHTYAPPEPISNEPEHDPELMPEKPKPKPKPKHLTCIRCEVKKSAIAFRNLDNGRKFPTCKLCERKIAERQAKRLANEAKELAQQKHAPKPQQAKAQKVRDIPAENITTLREAHALNNGTLKPSPIFALVRASTYSDDELLGLEPYQFGS